VHLVGCTIGADDRLNPYFRYLNKVNFMPLWEFTNSHEFKTR